MKAISHDSKGHFNEKFKELKQHISAAYIAIGSDPTLDSLKTFNRCRKAFYDFEGIYIEKDSPLKRQRLNTTRFYEIEPKSQEEDLALPPMTSIKTQDLQNCDDLQDLLNVIFSNTKGSNDFEKFEFLETAIENYKMPLFDSIEDSNYIKDEVYLFCMINNSELETLNEEFKIIYRSNLINDDYSGQFVAVDLFTDPISALVGAYYYSAKGYLSSKICELNLICFRPRAVNGIKEAIKANNAHVYDDQSMKSTRLHNVYKFDQAELDSMVIVKFNFKLKNLRESMQGNENLLRLFGRFYNPLYGISTSLLHDMVTFSTFQSLKQAKLYFLDEIDDDTCVSIVDKLKRYMSDQSVDMSEETNWPICFLKRIKKNLQDQGSQVLHAASHLLVRQGVLRINTILNKIQFSLFGIRDSEASIPFYRGAVSSLMYIV